jgi:YfiH family protein
MPFIESGGLRLYTFDILQQAGIVHGVFTRHGGVSQGVWKSLNVGGTVGDNPQHVAENRRRCFQALGRHATSLYDVWQVHGVDVVCVERPRLPDQPYSQADIILTDRPGITLMMRFADCVPILLYDPNKRVIGLAHAGWKGTVLRAAAFAIEALTTKYGSQPRDLLAGIGPSIGPDHYFVGPEVVSEVYRSFGSDASELLLLDTASDCSERDDRIKVKSSYAPDEPDEYVHKPEVQVISNGQARFDLQRANRLVLEQSGVHQVEMSGLCTACHLQDWYSHRAEVGRTGRFGVLIGLPDR